MISPGMLNMTALKVRLESGKSGSVKFAFGAAIVVSLQAGIAMYFANYFVNHPKVIEFIEEIGVGVLFILSIVFFKMSRNKADDKGKSIQSNFMIKGALMAALDVLTIPFYIAVSTYLASKNKLIIDQPYMFLFMVGVLLGAFLLLNTYIYFSELISRKVSFITKNINKVLSIIFLVLGTITLIKLL